MKRLSNEEFIDRVKKIHGDRYDYTNCMYTTMKQKVNVRCIKHNFEFLVSPVKHLASQGCPKCCKEKLAALKQLDTPEFIKRATAIHGDTYDYSRVKYVNAQEKVEIICKTHGSFWMTPNNHTNKANKCGCPTCRLQKIGPDRKTTEWFVSEAKAIHGDKFDYSGSEYVGCFDDISIRCRTHGEFFQKAYQHFATSVCCPQCTTSVSKAETAWLDSLGIPVGFRQKRIKIGDRVLSVDGINYKTKTIYEFYGDYWHGNPKTMSQDKFNDRAGMTYGELYQKTTERENLIKENGYQLVAIWESDWHQLKKSLKGSVLNTSNTQPDD